MKKSLLAVSISVLLASCVSMPDKAAEDGQVNDQVEITAALGEQESRLICNSKKSSELCDLRIFHIMTEAFADGDPATGFGDGYGTSHHHGDLVGVTQSLDYIKASGFNAIWLTPIFHSAPMADQNVWADKLDATGYFASNYFAIDPRFGSMDDARTLVQEAHSRGLYVFFDGVFGHFKNNANNYPSPSGLTLSEGGKPQAGVGREAIYPDDLDFFKEVATYWIKELKIDGWRLDQAYQVPVRFWPELRTAVEEASQTVTYKNDLGETVHPLGYMVGEIWNDAGYIAETGYGTDEAPALDSAFDFPVRTAVVQTFGSDKEGNHGRPATHLANAMAKSVNYPDHAMPNLMLSTHDVPRFGNLLKRARLADYGSEDYWARHRAAMSFMAAYSGPLTWLYNDEIGARTEGFSQPVSGDTCAMRGLCDDHVGRISGQTEVSELSQDEVDLRHYFNQLMQWRDQHPALSKGARTHIYSDDRIYIDRKDLDDDHVLYLVNVSNEDVLLRIHGSAIGSEGSLTDLMDGTVTAVEQDVYNVRLQALESRFLNIEAATEVQTDSGQVSTITDDMARCDIPDATGAGPLGKDMWIRGSYRGGNNFMATPDSRKFRFKGDNLYQVVVNEPASTAFSFKFASSGWSPEMAVKGSAPVQLGVIQDMAPASGYGTESSVVIPEPGEYVYSFRIDPTGRSGSLYIGRCQ
ncbi:alpha-amylase family glycosyl hydrolase [Endozoicomonas gorgoniicola]|uniref:Alpha-amylase family glycosyl hydrolase n=1 Tax=Endozoicomonas gorgoniicola TaxID=1234144 RepID=A0ABT3N0V3_9GAMM|nr:alpha-amylase family glycosyl hydrolase [Endozoicomonas gorgoniicola]MCW7555247.1 alpha-amylase family glycosyl hydrolase [Endozoicomonas gorgoniicola]